MDHPVQRIKEIGDAGARKASQDDVRATDFVTSFQKCKLSFNLLGGNSIEKEINMNFDCVLP